MPIKIINGLVYTNENQFNMLSAWLGYPNDDDETIYVPSVNEETKSGKSVPSSAAAEFDPEIENDPEFKAAIQASKAAFEEESRRRDELTAALEASKDTYKGKKHYANEWDNARARIIAQQRKELDDLREQNKRLQQELDQAKRQRPNQTQSVSQSVQENVILEKRVKNLENQVSALTDLVEQIVQNRF